MPEKAVDWNDRSITLARSKGGVRVVRDFSDNLIRDDRLPWPPPPVVQKLYESGQSRAFEGDELAAATAVLGFYSDLQSLNSEDAITWSYFGPFLAETPEARAAFLNWLLEQVGLPDLARSRRCEIDLWRRIPHPDRPTSSGGPELDIVLDGDRAVVFCEAKWRSKEAMNQGVDGTKSQMQLRRDFLGRIGPQVYGDRGFVVCGIVLDEPLAAVTPPDAHGVHTVSIRWAELASYPAHPKGDEFSRYLAWKESFLTPKRAAVVAESAPERRVMGVDAYRGGWVAVEIDEAGTLAARTEKRFAELLETAAVVVAVDIPIGVPDTAARVADAEARSAVGARHASVFTTPLRAVLEAATYEDAKRVAADRTGKTLSKQAFNLRHRIFEVEPLAEIDDRVIEVHPEVSFSVLAGEPLTY
jgi:hypothetical protein